MCDLEAKLDQVLEALEEAKTQLAVQQVLIAEDRVQIARLLILANRLLAKAGDAAGLAAGVADDLAASIDRADEAPAGTPGAGADAALRAPQDS